MTQRTDGFDACAFSKQPGYDERAVRLAFARAVPLRTVVVYCYDPRAVGIPAAVAKEFGDVFPGAIVRDDGGKKVASTTTLFEVVVAGGRAIDALRSVTVAQHLFGIERIVIVHHTYCGATSFTADGIIQAYAREQGTDIGSLYPRDSICITDYVTSLRHDVRLMRMSAGTPRRVSIYGYMYDIDAEALSLVVEDTTAPTQRGSGPWRGLSVHAENPPPITRLAQFGELVLSPEGRNSSMSPQALLKFALAVFGTVFLLVYPLAIVWPSGWAWHAGAPQDSQYFMMIVGVYATLGFFLLMATRNPQAHRSLIWFVVWSSVVHGGIMAVQSMPAEHHGHLLGDVPALLLVAIVLGGLLVWSDAGHGKAA